MNETLRVIQSRRSIRKYRAEQVDDTDLKAILAAAVYAPSAMNQQKWHFTVIQSRAMLDKILQTVRENVLNSGIEELVERAKSPDFNIFYNAPTIVLITADENAHFTEFDCGAAAENIALAAESLGVGSCLIGMSGFLFESETADEIKKKLGIPQGYKHILSIALGYREGASPAPPPKNMDVVNYIR